MRGRPVPSQAGRCDQPPVTIHPEHPFLSPAEDRDPLRRLRARLVTPVTIWTASTEAPDGRLVRTGFTVGSTTVADGDPAYVLGMIDPEADLWATVEVSGRFAVSVLHWADRHLADVFAGIAPAPGGGFGIGTWLGTPCGPVLDGRTWVGCRLVESRPVGFGRLVTGAVEEIVVDPRSSVGDRRSGGDVPAEPSGVDPTGDEPADVLARLRGRYTAVPAPRR